MVARLDKFSYYLHFSKRQLWFFLMGWSLTFWIKLVWQIELTCFLLVYLLRLCMTRANKSIAIRNSRIISNSNTVDRPVHFTLLFLFSLSSNNFFCSILLSKLFSGILSSISILNKNMAILPVCWNYIRFCRIALFLASFMRHLILYRLLLWPMICNMLKYLLVLKTYPGYCNNNAINLLGSCAAVEHKL